MGVSTKVFLDDVEPEESKPLHLSLSPTSTLGKPKKCRRFLRNYGNQASQIYKKKEEAQGEESYPWIYGSVGLSYRGPNMYLRNSQTIQSLMPGGANASQTLYSSTRGGFLMTIDKEKLRNELNQLVAYTHRKR